MSEIKTPEQGKGALDPSKDPYAGGIDDPQPQVPDPAGSGRAKGHATERPARENDRVGVVSDPDVPDRRD